MVITTVLIYVIKWNDCKRLRGQRLEMKKAASGVYLTI